MPAFDYIAVDSNGKRHKGVLEAESPRQTRQLLREKGLIAFSVEEAARAYAENKYYLQAGARPFQRISLRDLSVITRQLATLINAGLPVEQALQVLSRQSDKPLVKSTLAALRGQVMEGKSLAASLRSFPQVFSELYRTSVHAGEHTGHLGLVMEYLANFSERSFEARQKIVLALLYPTILTLVSFAIIIFMLAYIVPDMVRVFSGAGEALPVLTRGLISLSDMLQHYWPVILVILMVAFFLAYKSLQRPALRLSLDRYILDWPVIGKLSLDYGVARFSAMVGMLHESGVPLVQALEIAIASFRNLHLRKIMQKVTVNVSEGLSLSRSMEETRALPPLLITMTASGEASGKLGSMLTRASQIQQADFENRVALLVGLFEPMILLVMGGMVLLLVLAIILPILNLNQLVK